MSVSKFKVGDRVYSPHFGEGIVTGIETNKLFIYPIHVDWTDKKQSESHHSDIFTPEGFYIVGVQNSEMDIVPAEEAADSKFKVGDHVWLNANERGTIVRFCTNEETCIVNSDIDGEVEMRTDALEKIEDSAINPAHYQVEGIPEAIEIMAHLMTKEQFEGFLWGNIMKYAYRYGRKGDKVETAGKIAWYANQLKAVEERGDGE